MGLPKAASLACLYSAHCFFLAATMLRCIASLRGRGISQEELAQAVKTTANTISRWETATYKPSISDLERLAQFFGVLITVFSPRQNPSHGGTGFSPRRPILTTPTWKRSCCTPSLEKRGIAREESARSNHCRNRGCRRIWPVCPVGRILPHSVSGFVTFYVRTCQ
jgi:transcriptional regulator with XRE-family HTH domain